MKTTDEYSGQFAIRASDNTILALASASPEPLISSETWHAWGEKFEAGEKAFTVVAGLAAVTGAEPMALAAGATAAVATVAAEIAKQQEAAAKAQEKANADKKAFEKQLRDSMDRAMRDHSDRMSRGDYRDPPSRERMAEIGRMA